MGPWGQGRRIGTMSARLPEIAVPVARVLATGVRARAGVEQTLVDGDRLNLVVERERGHVLREYPGELDQRRLQLLRVEGAVDLLEELIRLGVVPVLQIVPQVAVLGR